MDSVISVRLIYIYVDLQCTHLTAIKKLTVQVENNFFFRLQRDLINDVQVEFVFFKIGICARLKSI